jgi:hypothetical protein
MLSSTVEPSTLLLLLLLPPSWLLQLRNAASCAAAGAPPVRNSAHHPAAEHTRNRPCALIMQSWYRLAAECTFADVPHSLASALHLHSYSI